VDGSDDTGTVRDGEGKKERRTDRETGVVDDEVFFRKDKKRLSTSEAEGGEM
jgi:hypothetical protein